VTSAARRLIVNADDLGYTEPVSRGILEAHERGIVTSASLMVDRPAAAAAVAAARGTGLSVGLHVELDDVPPERCEEELTRQLARFSELVGARPTHVDSHHHTHRRPGVRGPFEAFALRERLPMRDLSVPHCGVFYGAPAIGVEHLLELLAGLAEGDTELGCHPGYAEGLESSYTDEREEELRTLTDPSVRARVEELGIHLIGWDEL
jgi:predicted glycoside hydrolase/deacetylase ChbG (UPF0249 family)